MLRRILSSANRTLSRLRTRSRDEYFEKLYERKTYLDAYSEHTDVRVERNPRAAVGGMWDEMGTLQFDFVAAHGLKPQHTLLDIGCGTLRGGRHFIRYLNPGNYCGIDISPKAIEYAERLVVQEGLSDKRPRLLVSRNKDLRFEEFDGEAFDYLLAQSVFTHLMAEHIAECFQNIGRAMQHDSVFFFTYDEAAEFSQTGPKDFRYPYAFFQRLADENGFVLTDRSADYPHPRGQRMAMISRDRPDNHPVRRSREALDSKE